MMLMMDPPQHDRFKLLVSRGFTPQERSAADATASRELAREIVDDVIERGECDLVHDVTGRLPSGLIAELMGMPREDGERLYELTEIMHTTDDAVAPPEASGAAIAEMLAYAQRVADRKRAEPGDDIASTLVQAEVDGDRLTDVEFQWFFLLLVNAGGDTTRNLLATGVQLLFDHPDQRARLAADLDGLLPTAVEEMLRYTSPVVDFRRTAMDDIELRGQPIAAGRQADGVLRLRQPRRGRVRRSRPCSTSAATRTRTWPSVAAARTCASASTSPASRSRRCCARSSPACRTWLPPPIPSRSRRTSSPASRRCRCGSPPAHGSAEPLRVRSPVVQIGVQLPETERVVRWPEMRRLVVAIERLGFDSVWVGDHYLYRRGGAVTGPWEVWTLLSAIAAVTERVTIAPFVASLTFHNPAVIAKFASTVDEVSAGRLVLGVGAGWNRTEYRGVRVPVRAARRPVRGGLRRAPPAGARRDRDARRRVHLARPVRAPTAERAWRATTRSR